ncbi:16S rRNA (adenine(1518)-N(6)/adenine(1519)-N(6))-dimethyltransferase, partial [Staphylococcus aureus]
LVTVDNEEAFFKLAKAAFAQRRKTINNNYQNYFKDGKQHKEVILQWLEQAGIDPRRRGETLSIQDFAKLYEEKKKFPQLEN